MNSIYVIQVNNYVDAFEGFYLYQKAAETRVAVLSAEHEGNSYKVLKLTKRYKTSKVK